MEKIEKLEKISYIKFDNGVEFKYERLSNELSEMLNADFTEFNLKSEKDKTLYELIKSKCIKDEICNEIFMTDTKIRVYWNDNEEIIESLLDDIYNIMYNC